MKVEEDFFSVGIFIHSVLLSFVYTRALVH